MQQPDSRKSIFTALVRRHPRRRLRQAQPERVDRLVLSASPIRAKALRKSSGGNSTSTNCAPIRGASATPP